MSAANALFGKSIKEDAVFLDVDAFHHGKFHIELNSHITVVSDNSGTGKSYLCELVENREINRIQIDSSLPVYVVDKIVDFLEIKEKSIILIDEDAKCIINNVKELQQIINNSDNLFLLFVRDEAFAEIPYSVDDIKVLRSYKGVKTLLNKYPVSYLNGCPKCNKHYIEDSTTGLTFFRKIFNDIVSIGGKDNYDLIDISEGNVLFIFDRCGFGSSYEKFYKKYCIYDNMYLLDYESFEYMLLQYISKVPVADISVKNKEEFYENTLQQYLTQYGKSLSCKCLNKCNNCKTCEYAFSLVNSRKVFKEAGYEEYVEV